MIPAKGEVRLRLRFVSNEVGQFDQTISFEILGTKRNYKIFCRGVCTFPTISREPRTVFPNRQKTRKANEIVHKKFILSTEQYDFGPLVLGKDVNKYVDLLSAARSEVPLALQSPSGYLSQQSRNLDHRQYLSDGC